MIYTSLAVLALSASTAVSPLSKLVHLHPHGAQPDTRVSLTIRNEAPVFQDVNIDGRSYTIGSKQGITIKAPAGTVVYAASSTGLLHRGEVVAQLSAQLNQKDIVLK
jgi:hypothetical protein